MTFQNIKTRLKKLDEGAVSDDDKIALYMVPEGAALPADCDLEPNSIIFCNDLQEAYFITKKQLRELMDEIDGSTRTLW